jgi:hypothetical protein
MKIALRAIAVLLVMVALGAGALLAIVGLNMRTYQRLTYERPVATLEFEEKGPQRYLATLTRLPTGVEQKFELAGDEWQVDARVLKWSGYATLLGLDSRYRLERVSGRYRDVDQDRTAPRSVYALGETPVIDLWSLAEAHPSWFFFLDGLYGSATYLPMAAGAEYDVTLTQSGLIARPRNDMAKTVSRAWR